MTRYDARARALAVALAALAGYVDAIGFLKLGGFFVSFMSGNTTRLAVGAARDGPMAVTGAILIGAFVAGVVLGSLVGEAAAERRKQAALVLAASLLGVAAWSGLAGFPGLIALPAAMGATNVVFQRDGEVAIGVTYMTGALVKLGQRIAAALRGRDPWGWLPYLALWLGLLGGAVIGAFAYPLMGLDGLWFAAVALLVMAFLAPATSGT